MSEYLGPMALAVANHLWQSTIVVAVAWLLTLMLRTNTARTRQGIWMAASLKFMLPFALVVAVGSNMPHPSLVPHRAPSALYTAMDQWTQPAIAAAVQPASTSLSASTNLQITMRHALPILLTAVWLCGFLAVVSIWSLRWHTLKRIQHAAVPMPEGRETAALGRLQQRTGASSTIRILRCNAATGQRLEPGVMGVRRPVLLWPEGISERLSDAQIEAILAHELQHIKHRDNLTAILHMMVEATFWFYPLVWWMETRLVEERERACDEEVLRLGNEPAVYAQSILKTCEFCVESPLACVTGVTGAELKKRIVQIMSARLGRELSLTKKVLLVSAASLVVAAPLVFGLVFAPQVRAQNAKMPALQTKATTGDAPSEVFEVASIKPFKLTAEHLMLGGGWSTDGFTWYAINLQALVEKAYGVQASQVSGGPSWVSSQRYDVQAKMSGSVADDLKKLSPDKRKIVQEHMLQALLMDRFHLVIHHEVKELPVYALVIAKSGTKLKEAKPGNTYSKGFSAPDGSPAGASEMAFGGGNLAGQGVPVSVLVSELSQQPELAGSTVIDRTNLTGKYDFTLQWTPQRSRSSGGLGIDDVPAPDSSGPSLFTALQEQLGVALKSAKGPVDTIVIDSAERASEN